MRERFAKIRPDETEDAIAAVEPLYTWYILDYIEVWFCQRAFKGTITMKTNGTFATGMFGNRREYAFPMANFVVENDSECSGKSGTIPDDSRWVRMSVPKLIENSFGIAVWKKYYKTWTCPYLYQSVPHISLLSTKLSLALHSTKPMHCSAISTTQFFPRSRQQGRYLSYIYHVHSMHCKVLWSPSAVDLPQLQPVCLVLSTEHFFSYWKKREWAWVLLIRKQWKSNQSACQ